MWLLYRQIFYQSLGFVVSMFLLGFNSTFIG